MGTAQISPEGKNLAVAGSGRARPRLARRRSAVCETPKARDTQRRILEAAMRIIATEGYHNTQYARIAETAGVARGVINYHFKTPPLLSAAVVAFVEERKSALMGALAARLRATPGDHVGEAIDGYWALLHETPFIAYAELEYAARTDKTLRRILLEPRRALDRGVVRSQALDPHGGGAHSDRQALYDLSRFLLEGLARGAMTYDKQVREMRLLRLLKKAVKALDEPAAAQPLWID